MERKNAWAAYAGDDGRVEAFAKAYCDFINNGKTERECVAYGEKLAKAHGFEDLNAVIRSGRKLEAGARVYVNWMGKSFMLFVLGEKPLAFACSCSRARVEAMLVSLGSEEADAAVAAGDGEARVTCEFCGQDYRFDAAQVATLFAQAAAAHPSPAALQ